MQNHQRDRKIGRPAAFSLARFAPRDEHCVASPVELLRLHTTYYDTSDLRLARWGCSLRFRVPDEWTLKLPPPAPSRSARCVEHVIRGAAGAIPAPLLDLATAYLRGASPHVVTELRTLRAKRTLRSPDGTDLAEIVEDDVHVVEGAAVVKRFRKFEIDLARDAPDRTFDELAELLRLEGAGVPDPTPKSVLALGPRAEIPELAPPAIDRDATAGDLFRATIARSVSQLVRNDAAIRVGRDPEGVHQARVAIRRLRSDLRTFGPVLEPGWATALRERIRWLGDGFGAARDADVLLERLQHRAADLPDVDWHGKELVLSLVRGIRRAAYRQLMTMLREARYVALIDELIAAARDPHLASEAGEPARDIVPHLMNAGWKKLGKRVRTRSHPPADGELHRIRIQAKRIRYAAEAVAPIYGGPAKAFAKRVDRLQAILGDQRDANVACSQLRAHIGGGESAFVAGELTTLESEAAARGRRKWHAAWRKSNQKRLRFWA